MQLRPAQLAGTRRTHYFFEVDAAMVGGQSVQGPVAISLASAHAERARSVALLAEVAAMAIATHAAA